MLSWVHIQLLGLPAHECTLYLQHIPVIESNRPTFSPRERAILPLACLHYLFLRVEWCGFNPANRRDNSFFPGFTSSVYFRRGAYLTHSECSVCMRHAGNAAAVCWPLIPHQWRAVFLEWWVWDERLFCKEVMVIIWKKLHWQWLEFTLPSSG